MNTGIFFCLRKGSNIKTLSRVIMGNRLFIPKDTDGEIFLKRKKRRRKLYIIVKTTQFDRKIREIVSFFLFKNKKKIIVIINEIEKVI
jgi:hypothetical protein